MEWSNSLCKNLWNEFINYDVKWLLGTSILTKKPKEMQQINVTDMWIV
jgi:hypothetical protein